MTIKNYSHYPKPAAIKALDGINIDVGLAAHTVTKALDYVGIEDNSHGRRIGLICHRIAHLLNWSQERRHFVLMAGMLHDCGVSSTETHKKLIEELEWSEAEDHCMRGEFFLESFSPFKDFAKTIRHHHTRWTDLPESLDQETKEYTNLIFLADRLDVAYIQFREKHPAYKTLLHKNNIVQQLSPYKGSLFSESLFDALEKVAQRDSFWLELEDDYLDEVIFETLASLDYTMRLGFDEIEALGELISQIVDIKSPFTHYHSLRVADLTYALSGLMGYDHYNKRILRLAGLLHDVGKLRTPDKILEKPSALTPDELAQMRSHPLDSKHVLQALFPNTPISRWASEHHEKLDGSGYPFGWSGDRIDEPTRILTISDIFQALCQKRPYRDRLSADKVIAIMDKMEAKGEIDSTIYRLLKVNRAELYQIAIRENEYYPVLEKALAKEV